MPQWILPVFIQGLGLIGLGFGVAAFQSSRHKSIVLLKLLNELVFAVQYVLLGAYTGAVMNLISCVRNYIYAKSVEKGRSTTPWIFIFSGIIVLSGILSWSSPLSLIPVAAKLLTCAAYGMKNPRTVRILTFPSSIGWIVYNAVYHSAGGVLNEVFTMASIAISMVRFDFIPYYRTRALKRQAH